MLIGFVFFGLNGIGIIYVCTCNLYLDFQCIIFQIIIKDIQKSLQLFNQIKMTLSLKSLGYMKFTITKSNNHTLIHKFPNCDTDPRSSSTENGAIFVPNSHCASYFLVFTACTDTNVQLLQLCNTNTI